MCVWCVCVWCVCVWCVCVCVLCIYIYTGLGNALPAKHHSKVTDIRAIY